VRVSATGEVEAETATKLERISWRRLPVLLSWFFLSFLFSSATSVIPALWGLGRNGTCHKIALDKFYQYGNMPA
jgi:hypothetical protein